MPETSKCYRHPGIAGGSPAYARSSRTGGVDGRRKAGNDGRRVGFLENDSYRDASQALGVADKGGAGKLARALHACRRRAP